MLIDNLLFGSCIIATTALCVALALVIGYYFEYTE